MTSPTQRKYLEAMGIPVWVSRDLVQSPSMDNDIEHSLPKTVADDHHKQADNPRSTKIQHNASTIANTSVEKILNDLNNTDLKPDADTSAKTSEETPNTVPESIVNKESKAVSTDVQSNNLLKQTEQYNIYGAGNLEADWLVIGYSPEAFNGVGNEPFAGEAGQLLDNMLRATGIEQPRTMAYYINVLDHYGTSVKAVEQNDIHDFLLAQVTSINPKIVLLVGQNAAQTVLKINDPLVKLRAQTHSLDVLDVPAVVTYYPSYLLSKPSDKRKAWNDLKQAMSLINNND